MTSDPRPLSDDAIAIVLAASHLGIIRGSGAEPLGPAQWQGVAEALHHADLTPAWLLGRDAAELRGTLDWTESQAERVALLMERAGNIGFELERLAQRGIWVVTRSDPDYPRRLASRLKGKRPPVLFGVGPRALLDAGGVAVVGSRNVDEAGGEFARLVGDRASQSGLNVVSGGARGVDRLAMEGALRAEGTAVGVLSDSLEKWLKDPELRGWIAAGNLTLATPFKPDSGFQASNAMARNKVIYCLADHAVVVASDRDKGGTWAGAKENLGADWVPLFVRRDTDAPDGNLALIARGGTPLDSDHLRSGDLGETLAALAAAPPDPGETAAQLGLFAG